MEAYAISRAIYAWRVAIYLHCIVCIVPEWLPTLLPCLPGAQYCIYMLEHCCQGNKRHDVNKYDCECLRIYTKLVDNQLIKKE